MFLYISKITCTAFQVLYGHKWPVYKCYIAYSFFKFLLFLSSCICIITWLQFQGILNLCFSSNINISFIFCISRIFIAVYTWHAFRVLRVFTAVNVQELLLLLSYFLEIHLLELPEAMSILLSCFPEGSLWLTTLTNGLTLRATIA
jgi:hypothetical protein